MRGEFYKNIDSNKRRHFEAWKRITIERIEWINLISGECYFLAYRGRNHRIVLMDGSHTLACGIIQINTVLTLLEERYNKKEIKLL